MSDQVHVLSVNVGTPASLGLWKGREVTSGIVKTPVQSKTLFVGELGLDGDQQADLKVHGGENKAVYAYPAEHYAMWAEELQRELPPVFFGENLCVTGLHERDVHIGDQWRWGDAVLEVTKPRQPCYKLIVHTGIDDIIQRMRANLRTGWYLKVLTPGMAPTSGAIEIIRRGEGETILANYAAKAARKLDPAFLG